TPTPTPKRIKAAGDLQGLMPRVIARLHAIGDPLRALQRIVAVQLDHQVTGRNRVRSINLDLVIVLRAGRYNQQAKEGETEDLFHRHVGQCARLMDRDPQRLLDAQVQPVFQPQTKSDFANAMSSAIKRFTAGSSLYSAVRQST